MRALLTRSIGVITAALFAGCSNDQAGTTAPTTLPSFKTFSPTSTYRFSFTCNSAAAASPPARAVVGAYHSNPPDFTNFTDFDLPCDGTRDVGQVYSFDYRINAGVSCDSDKPNGKHGYVKEPSVITCTDGDFSATLTVSEVTP